MRIPTDAIVIPSGYQWTQEKQFVEIFSHPSYSKQRARKLFLADMLRQFDEKYEDEWVMAEPVEG